jgi:hypothetical protein
MQAADGARRHLPDQLHAGGQEDRALRAGWGQLDDPHALGRLDVDVLREAHLVDVEGLGAVHVGDRHRYELELHVHGARLQALG